MDIGSTVVARGRAYEVVRMLPSGDVQGKCIITGALHWFDVYAAHVVDPNESPGALLDAMSLINGLPSEHLDTPRPDGCPQPPVDLERRAG